MIRSEAQSVLSKALERYSGMSWHQLSDATDRNQIDDFEAMGDSGTTYQIEVNLVWDSEHQIRVLGMIDDSGLSSFTPLCEDILIGKSSVEKNG